MIAHPSHHPFVDRPVPKCFRVYNKPRMSLYAVSSKARTHCHIIYFRSTTKPGVVVLLPASVPIQSPSPSTSKPEPEPTALLCAPPPLWRTTSSPKPYQTSPPLPPASARPSRRQPHPHLHSPLTTPRLWRTPSGRTSLGAAPSPTPLTLSLLSPPPPSRSRTYVC